MATPKQILLVGHCGADVFSLKMVLSTAAPGVPVDSAADVRALDKRDLSECLLLINRRLPASYPTPEGVELIRQFKQRPDAPAMMLISDYPDAQAQAVQAGACPGFGKGELRGEKPAERIRAALGLGKD